MNGRKIKKEFENPIDNILIYFCIIFGKKLKELNFTPNILTTISLLITLIGIYFIYINNFKLGSLLIFIGYFFDVFDGTFARRYNMVTKFGDYYDHISDTIKIILLIFIITISKIKLNTKIIFFMLFFILSFFMLLHLGCQEKYYHKKSILSKLKFLCFNKKNIYWTKYIGCGTFFFILCLYIFFMEVIDRFMI